MQSCTSWSLARYSLNCAACLLINDRPAEITSTTIIIANELVEYKLLIKYCYNEQCFIWGRRGGKYPLKTFHPLPEMSAVIIPN